MASKDIISAGGLDIKVAGRLLRTAHLNDEYYVGAADPATLIAELKHRRVADVFTFVQDLHDPKPRFEHRMSWDKMAVLRLDTYAHWFDKQIKFKPRNRLRKAWKAGVDTRMLDFSDDLVRSIMEIYNETPLRQGKRNWHYGKDFDTVKREHATFLERSEFIGAWFKDELVGFAKITHGDRSSIIMNIVAKMSARDMSPMNALIAKSVECAAARSSALLNYGVWGRRGMNEFKVAQAFECLEVPRYHVPLTAKGAWALKHDLHRGLKERMPEAWIVKLADTRARLNGWLHRTDAAPRPPQAATAKAGAPADTES
ncbi:MAG: hypothetical protein H7276_04140 [Caulobacter sp.]|nr:hypothetical protein [Vitreoscilla sp.]